MRLSLSDEIGILICLLIAIVSNDGLEISLRLMSRSPSDMARPFPWTGRVETQAGVWTCFTMSSFYGPRLLSFLKGATHWSKFISCHFVNIDLTCSQDSNPRTLVTEASVLLLDYTGLIVRSSFFTLMRIRCSDSFLSNETAPDSPCDQKMRSEFLQKERPQNIDHQVPRAVMGP